MKGGTKIEISWCISCLVYLFSAQDSKRGEGSQEQWRSLNLTGKTSVLSQQWTA